MGGWTSWPQGRRATQSRDRAGRTRCRERHGNPVAFAARFGGLPKPLSQVAIYDDAGFFLGRLDLFYPDKRLAVEYDGATHRDSLTSDNRRQNRLIDSGYRILRFTASDVF